MKIVGISVGRNNSNTEIMVKETLRGAEAAGAEVEFIRLHDVELKPCTGCNSCVIDLFEKGGTGACTIKGDDYAFIDDKIMDADGLVVGSPIYEKSPAGLLKVLNDRMGPGHDLAFRTIAREIREKAGITVGTGPDPRAFKPRAATLIAIGGSEWDALALPMLHMFCMSMQIEVLDKIQANWIGLPGTILFHEEWLERANKSGRHLVESLKRPLSEAKYIGPEDWVCPMCHSKLIEFRTERKSTSAKCGMCGVKGTLNIVNGQVVFELTEEAKLRSCVTMSGKFHHADDLRERSLKPHPNYHEMPERLKKYSSYLKPSKPEKRQTVEVK